MQDCVQNCWNGVDILVTLVQGALREESQKACQIQEMGLLGSHVSNEKIFDIP